MFKRSIFFGVVLLVCFGGMVRNGAEVYAQGRGVTVGSGNVWNDSLKSAFLTTGSDTVKIFDLGMKYHLISIAVTDTGAVITDSVQAFVGVVKLYSSGVAYDTVWSAGMSLKKFSDMNTYTNHMVGANATGVYFGVVPVVRLLKVVLVNQQWVSRRRCTVVVSAIY